jgi:SAM-dependent methyltransferase
MTTHSTTISPAYFEEKYRTDIDPWRFRTSPYEKDKYRATLTALSRQRYKRVLEVGCAIGVLTALLAPRCEQLLAVDGSERAIDEARQQLLPNVYFERAFLPDEFPEGTFDLIILSEVLYYFNETDLLRLADKCLCALEPGGEIILCHWLGETDYPLTGRRAGELFTKAVARHRPAQEVLHEDIYRLERLCFPLSV